MVSEEVDVAASSRSPLAVAAVQPSVGLVAPRFPLLPVAMPAAGRSGLGAGGIGGTGGLGAGRVSDKTKTTGGLRGLIASTVNSAISGRMGVTMSEAVRGNLTVNQMPSLGIGNMQLPVAGVKFFGRGWGGGGEEGAPKEHGGGNEQD